MSFAAVVTNDNNSKDNINSLSKSHGSEPKQSIADSTGSSKELSKAFESVLASCRKLSTGIESWTAGAISEDLISNLYTDLLGHTNRVLELTLDHPSLMEKGKRLGQLGETLKECLESILSDSEAEGADEKAIKEGRWAEYKTQFTEIVGTWMTIVKSMRGELIQMGMQGSSRRRSSLKLDTGYPLDSSTVVSATPISERSSTPVGLDSVFKVPMSPWDKAVKEYTYSSTGGVINSQSSISKIMYRKFDYIYLQIGDSVKKTSFDGNFSFQAIQMMFVEKFQFNAGMDVFPLILIRGEEDKPDSVFYELENLEDVKEGSLLKLRTATDSKDFIIHNIQTGFNTLAKELHGIKKILNLHKQESAQQQQGTAASSTQVNLRFGQAVEQIRKSISKSLTEFTASPKIAANFKIRGILDDVSQLRSDILQIKQRAVKGKELFLSDSLKIQEAINTFRASNPPSLSTARIDLNNQKSHIVLESENIAKRMKDLQEIVEEMRLDVTQRKCTPGENKMTIAFGEALAIQQGLLGLRDYVDDCKSGWKKTWEVELQSIVAEQQLLKDRTKGLDEMEEDHEGLLQMVQSIKQVIEIQQREGTTGGGKRPVRSSFSMPPPDANFEGLPSILQEIQTVETDSKQRMEAIARAERIRNREKEFREDPFSKELKTFINQDKFKKTGGIDEIDRIREKKNKEILSSLQQ